MALLTELDGIRPGEHARRFERWSFICLAAVHSQRDLSNMLRFDAQKLDTRETKRDVLSAFFPSFLFEEGWPRICFCLVSSSSLVQVRSSGLAALFSSANNARNAYCYEKRIVLS